jgi:hypothetical protein
MEVEAISIFSNFRGKLDTVVKKDKHIAINRVN